MALAIVTGGAGFIGSHLAEMLLSKGFEVKAIDDLSGGSLQNLSGAKGRFSFVEGSITDSALLKKEFKGAEFVFHAAAKRCVRQSLLEPLEYHRTNIDGVLNVLEACRANDVKRVIFSSSSSVYGNAKEFPQKETLYPEPLSPYAITKLAGEQYFRAYHDLYGLGTISLRYFNVFGPRQSPDSTYGGVIPIFISRAKAGEPIVIFGDGSQSRDFTFVKDIANANIVSANAHKSACGKVYNMAPGKSITVLYIAGKLKELMKSSSKIVFEPPRKVDILKSQADNSLAAKALGISSFTGFDNGLKRTVEWFCR